MSKMSKCCQTITVVFIKSKSIDVIRFIFRKLTEMTNRRRGISLKGDQSGDDRRNKGPSLAQMEKRFLFRKPLICVFNCKCKS